MYERFLDPRAEGFNDPERWDEVSTLGHTGRRYLSEDELYAAALEREPDATPERRAELRYGGGEGGPAQRGVLRRHVQRAEVGDAAAHRVRGPGGRRPHARATRRPRQAWAAFRQAVEDAIWAGNNAGLAYLAEHAGYSRVGHHGGAGGPLGRRPRLGRRRRSSSTTPATTTRSCTSTTALLNRVQGPDGVWRTLDGRSLYRLAAGRGGGRRAHDRGAAHPRARGAGRDPPGRQGPRDRRRRPGGDGPDLHPAPHRSPRRPRSWSTRSRPGYGRAPNGLERDRLPSRPRC